MAKSPEAVSLRCPLPAVSRLLLLSTSQTASQVSATVEAGWPIGWELTVIILVSEHSFVYLLVGLF